MESTVLQSLRQQTSVLSRNEKVSLAEHLLRQAELDAAPPANGHVHCNGDSADTIDPLRRREYEWLREHRHEYGGQYVALFNEQLISHGDDPRIVLNAARQKGFSRPLMVWVDPVETTHYLGS
jgi:Family of unknown function (DUF5678)